MSMVVNPDRRAMGRLVVVAVGAAVITSTITSGLIWWWVKSDRRFTPGPVVEIAGDVKVPVAESEHLAGASRPPATVEESARAIVDLQRTVEDLRARLDQTTRVPSPPDPRAVLQRLVSLEGERQMVIRSTLEELVALGPVAVAEILAWLRNGEDRSYGGGYSTGGGGDFRSYPRLRTVLMDALRQIGTAEAQDGLMEIVGGSKSLIDFRDLLLLYGNTQDKRMTEGVSALVPQVLTRLQALTLEDAKSVDGNILGGLMHWIRRHDLQSTVDLLVPLVQKGESQVAQEALAALVAMAPERAASAAYRAASSGSLSQLSIMLRISDVRLDNMVVYLEALFAQGPLGAKERESIYISLPYRLGSRPSDKAERIAAGKRYLTFLTGRLGQESDKSMRSQIERAIERLRTQIADAEK